jgi:TPR repeat protein
MSNRGLKIAELEALLRAKDLSKSDEGQLRYELARLLRKEGRYEEAFEESRKAAEAGDALSEGIVGFCALSGVGCPQDIEGAKRAFLKGIKAKDAASLLGMVALYTSFEKDKRKADRYFHLAAQTGNPDAECAYGLALLKGEAVDARPWAGRRYLKKAAYGGDGSASYALAKIYETGAGVKADAEKALHYYLLSAEQGYLPAQYLLSHHQKGAAAPAIDKTLLEELRLLSRKEGAGFASDFEEVLERCGAYAKSPALS